jgi:hypothetical protein
MADDGDDLRLTRFERELIRRLRALPFEVQQHIARYVIRLQREHGTVPMEPAPGARPGDPESPVWTITVDELARIREELGLGDQDE